MKQAHAHLQSLSPYQQGKHIYSEKLEKELYDDFEKRTWRERAHVDENGYIFIPPQAFKKCLTEAAEFLSMQIKGKGKQTYTKHFKSGIIVEKGLTTNVKIEDVKGEPVFVPSDGQPGGGKRVLKYFPTIEKWEGKVTFWIIDDIITEEVFKRHLEQAGMLIGLGVYRPRRDGHNGRFRVLSVVWEDMRL